MGMNLKHPICASVFGCLAVATGWAQPRPASPAPVKMAAVAPQPAADDFYVPLPPRYVAGPLVSEAKWSPDGRYVTAVALDIDLRTLPGEGIEPPHTTSLVIWNASTHKSSTVWSDSSTDSEITDVEWLPGTSVVFVTARWTAETESTNQGLWRIDARRMGGAKIDGYRQDERLLVSPNQPYAFLQGNDREGAYLKPLAATGSIGQPIRIPAGVMAPRDWSQDGRSLLLTPLAAVIEGTAPALTKPSWMACDGRTGALSSLGTIPKPYEPSTKRYAFSVVTLPVPHEPSTNPVKVPWGNENIHAAWLLQGTKPANERILIAANADRAEISPSGDAILYTNSEGVFVVDLLRTPKAVIDKARAAAQKTQLLNNGKQIALAVIMWAQDHDENLPTQDGDLKGTLMPYVKNDSVFGGGDGSAFVYSLNGGPLSDIKDPANTMMGYIQGPGGYAVVYADGHVQWSTELPK